MQNLAAAVFVYVSTFEANLGKTTPTAYADRECAMDRLIAAAFEAVEESVFGGREAVDYGCIDAALDACLELAEIITMSVQDEFLSRGRLKGSQSIHARTEDLVVDLLEEARDYLYDSDDDVESL